ncbi:MAG TPA: hypothetical protein PKI46_04845, partial [Bacteroidales bacterium]|nr:hypothetical protein [Bacteroidales bacterium]
TATRFFDKKFRVSHDGLIYTDWYELTNSNVSQISGSIINNNLFIQYRYERLGTDLSGILEVVSVSINGNVTIIECNSPVTNNSIFKGLSCGNFITMQLCNNLLKKLYRKGIIPEYITRGVQAEDEDYIAFWSTVACYMAMFVTYMYRFENIYMERNLLIEYLSQMNINVCEWEDTLEDLQYISDNYLDEIRKRSTKSIFLRKNEEYQDTTLVPVDGEILRLLCVDKCDEFLWTLRDLKNTGFNIGNSSPMYKGTCFDFNLVKAFEKEYGIHDVTKYPFFGGTPSHNAVNKTATINSNMGLGFSDFNTELNVKEKGFVVDSKIDYEITFEITLDNLSNNINFGCHVFDCYDNKYTTVEAHTGSSNYLFLKNYNIKQVNKKIFVRGILYGYNHPLIQFADKNINVAAGQKLKFGSLNITRLMPYLKVENSNAVIHDFKVRPLNYNHSIGFLNTANFIELFTKNNNKKKTTTEIYNIIRRDLIPYNTNLVINLRDGQSIPSDTIVYVHIDTSSMAITDQNTIKNVVLSWWSDFRLQNPDFRGSLLINTVNNSDISNNFAAGRGGNGRNTIAGSNLNTGTVEAWLQNPAEALLRFSWKEGLNNFSSEQEFLDYIEDRSLIVLSFTDETEIEYHRSIPVSFTQSGLSQPYPDYVKDYNNFVDKVSKKLKFFKGTLYPITRTNSANNNLFLLQAMGAIEGRNLT